MIGSFVKLLKYTVPVLVLSLLSYILFTESPIDPDAFELPPFPGLPSAQDTLYVKSALSLPLIGPESIAVDPATGVIYTGLMNGLIVKVGSNFEFQEVILRVGDASVDDAVCNDVKSTPVVRCGRPFGIRFHKSFLYVIDTFNGIFVIDLNTKTKTLLVDINKPSLYGLTSRIVFMDDLTLNAEGTKIYFTDASYKYSVLDLLYEVFESKPRGRLFCYDMVAKKLTTLLDNLYFSNGIELDYSGTALLITETTRYRIFRYYIENGTVDLFADNIIGNPDNIRKAESGGYWVGLPSLRDFLTYYLARYPILSKTLLKLFSIQFITGNLIGKTGQAIRFNENGQVVEFLLDGSAKYIAAVSEVLEFNHSLYIGSFIHPYMVKIDRES